MLYDPRAPEDDTESGSVVLYQHYYSKQTLWCAYGDSFLECRKAMRDQISYRDYKSIHVEGLGEADNGLKFIIYTPETDEVLLAIGGLE